jgi:hypothetical protein
MAVKLSVPLPTNPRIAIITDQSIIVRTAIQRIGSVIISKGCG